MDMNLAGYLAYDQSARAVKYIPKEKAPGIDAVMMEITEVGSNHILSVTLPLYIRQSPGLEWSRKFETKQP